MSLFGEVVRARARHHGERVAYIFLADGEREAASLTYRRLAAEVEGLARRLAAEAQPGERALLVYPPGLEFVVAFLACLEAGLVAVPVHPPRPRAGLGTLGAFATDATPRLLLGTEGQLDRLRRAAEDTPAPGLAAARWQATALATARSAPGPSSDDSSDDAWRPPAFAEGDLAFLQYTSGSTAEPKGVMVTHANLAANEAAIEASFGMSEASVVVSWLPPYHDMGLIGTVLQPLWCGGKAVLMSPLSFLQRPRRWLEAVTRYRATTTGGPDFAYALTERRVPESERDGLDLSSLTVAFSGAEPVRPETVERFQSAFAPCGLRRQALYPCYGLAEATLFVSGGHVAEAPVVREVGDPTEPDGVVVAGLPSRRRLVGCGRTWAGEEIAIADPESGRRLPPGREGEIRVAGPSVARGYWGRGEETRHAFGEPLEEGGPPFLRTGDLGFLDAAGELFVSGRLKDLIVVRGRNLYPQDLEAAAEGAHPAVRAAGAAAFGIEVDGAERVVVALEVERREEAVAGAVVEAVRQALVTSHEVAAHQVLALRAGSLLRTTSGKVRRQPCRQAYLAGELETLAAAGPGSSDDGTEPEGVVARPESATKRRAAGPGRRTAGGSASGPEAAVRVAAVVGEVTGATPAPGARLHLDSLQAVEVAQRLERRLGVAPPPSLLLASPTVGEVETWLETAAKSAASDDPSHREAASRAGKRLPIPPVEVVEGRPYRLAAGQRALLLAERMGSGDRQTALACAARWSRADGSPLAATEVEAALLALVQRHAALRFSFPVLDDQPVQVAGPPRLDFAAIDAADLGEAELRAACAETVSAPFDLTTAPPLRARWWHGGPAGDGLLVLAVHHVAADFASFDLLVADLVAELSRGAGTTGGAGGVSDPGVHSGATYPSFVAWQEAWLDSAAGRQAMEGWRRELAGLPPALELPTDRPRPPVFHRQGEAVRLRLPSGTADRLAGVARQAGTTPFAWAAAVWQALLGRWAGAGDLAVATAVAGRPAPELAAVVGHFVNLLPLRSDLDATTWSGLAAAAGRRLGAALDRQHLPFPRLVEAVAPPRDPSRHPLAQVGLVLESPRRLASLAQGSGAAALVLGEAAPPFRLGGLAVEPVALPRRTAELDLLLMLVEDGAAGGGGLAVALEYATALFDATTAERLLGWWRNALMASLEQPQGRWSEASFLALDEVLQIRAAVSRPRTGEPSPDATAGAASLPVHRAFAAHARRTPQAPAVVHLAAEEEGTEVAVVTYGELARRVDLLAARLAARGVGPESRVGILVRPTPARVVAVLAVLRAGGCFLALAPSDPPRRHADLLTAAGARHLISDTEPPTGVEGMAEVQHLRIDDMGGLAGPVATATAQGVDARPSAVADHPDSAAYVVFTSGSTGRPKGVVIPHRAVAALAETVAEDRRLGPGSRHLHLSALTFDISIGELLMPLVNGSAVALASDDARRSGVVLAREARLLAATHAVTTPAILALVPAGDEPPSLADVCVGGEVCPPEVAERWVPLLAGHGGALHNAYGPAETTVHSTLSSCPPGGVEAIRYLGRPSLGTYLRLTDRHGGEALPGATGEIHIGGPGLARGYLGQPAATAERFVPDPAAGHEGVPAGARLYRTGDLARRGLAGELRFAGRLDRQLKVRGVRIEPAEVEAALSAHPAVAAAAVDRRGERLVAWLVPAAGCDLAADLRSATSRSAESRSAESRSAESLNPAPSDAAPGSDTVQEAFPLRGEEAAALRRFLKDGLPASLVPDRVLVVERLPLTGNGKVDRDALPWDPTVPGAVDSGTTVPGATVPDATDSSAAASDVASSGASPSSAPRDRLRTLEALVARLWAEELELESVPLAATFFDLGGHSLALARIHQRLCRELGREVPLPDLFSHASVAGLAAHLAAGEAASEAAGKAAGKGSAATPGIEAGQCAETRRDAMRRLRRRRSSVPAVPAAPAEPTSTAAMASPATTASPVADRDSTPPAASTPGPTAAHTLPVPAGAER